MQQYESTGLGFMAIHDLSLSNICKSNESDLVRIFNKNRKINGKRKVIGEHSNKRAATAASTVLWKQPNAKRNLILFSNPVNLLEIYR